MRLGFSTPPLGFEKLLETPLPLTSEDIEILAMLAARLDKNKQNEEALAAYDEILRRDPDHLPSRFHHAVVLHRLGRPRPSRSLSKSSEHPRFEELAFQNPMVLRGFHLLVDNFILHGETQKALQFAQRGVALSENYPQVRGESRYALARAYAILAQTNPTFLDESVRALQAAGQSHTMFLDQWFVRDHVFDPIRHQFPRPARQTCDREEAGETP